MQAALSSFGIATGIAAVVLLVSIVSGMHRYAIEQFGADRRQHDSRHVELGAIDARSARVHRHAANRPIWTRCSSRSAHYDAGMAENTGFGVRAHGEAVDPRGAQCAGITTAGFELLNCPDRARPVVSRQRSTSMAHASRCSAPTSPMDLFAGESPVGQTIVIGDWPFQVVGVLDWVGDPNAGRCRAAGSQHLRAVQGVRGRVSRQRERQRRSPPSEDPPTVPRTPSPRRRPFSSRSRKQRGETSGEFKVISSIERMGELNLVLNAIKLVVGLVGGIGLFVGAVGVANVLFVSVRERRAEIGTRRAVGATRRAIFAGFLIEALAMTLSGGIVGIVRRLGAHEDRDLHSAKCRPARVRIISLCRPRSRRIGSADAGRPGRRRVAGQARGGRLSGGSASGGLEPFPSRVQRAFRLVPSPRTTGP